MTVLTQSKDYHLEGRMSKYVLDEDIHNFVRSGPVTEGYVMVFVAGCVAALAVTEAEPGIMTHDLDHFFASGMGVPYGNNFADGTPYRHHETWHDDNGSSHLRALMLQHSLTIPVVDGKAQLGPWQNVLLIECDTGPRTRKIWFQVQGE